MEYWNFFGFWPSQQLRWIWRRRGNDNDRNTLRKKRGNKRMMYRNTHIEAGGCIYSHCSFNPFIGWISQILPGDNASIVDLRVFFDMIEFVAKILKLRITIPECRRFRLPSLLFLRFDWFAPACSSLQCMCAPATLSILLAEPLQGGKKISYKYLAKCRWVEDGSWLARLPDFTFEALKSRKLSFELRSHFAFCVSPARIFGSPTYFQWRMTPISDRGRKRMNSLFHPFTVLFFTHRRSRLAHHLSRLLVSRSIHVPECSRVWQTDTSKWSESTADRR